MLNFRKKQKKKKPNHLVKTLTTKILLTGFLFIVTACGETTFRQVFDSARTTAPGSFFIPPAVDILLVQDDTGSMLESFDEVSQEIPSFLERIEGRGWDYHFTALPLTGTIPTPIQIVTSKYDGNWALNGRQGWKPLFPGVTPNMPGLSIPAQFFIEPWNFIRFLQRNQVSNQARSHEEGFKRIDTALNSTLNQTGFLRPGAIAVVIVMSNGDDTSDYTYCRRSDGRTVPCPGVPTQTFSDYEQRFQNLTQSGKTADFRLFSIVAPNQTTDCLGATSRRGERYLNMADRFNGQISNQFNICRRPIAQNIRSVLEGIGSQLEQTLLQFVTEFVAVNPEPDLNQEIVVTKYIDGDVNQPVIIPRDSVDGWSYLGYRENINSITYPFDMRPISGFIFQLNGTAQLEGLDTIKIQYKHLLNN